MDKDHPLYSITEDLQSLKMLQNGKFYNAAILCLADTAFLIDVYLRFPESPPPQGTMVSFDGHNET